MINKISEITILSNRFEIIYDDSHNGGSFNFSEGKIEVGVKSIDKDPLYVISIISHEVMEAILECMGARYADPRIGGNYLFNFNHQTFKNAIQLHTEIMSKFYYKKLGSKELLGGVQESFKEHKKLKADLNIKAITMVGLMAD
jgi:hypothetical protein